MGPVAVKRLCNGALPHARVAHEHALRSEQEGHVGRYVVGVLAGAAIVLVTTRAYMYKSKCRKQKWPSLDDAGVPRERGEAIGVTFLSLQRHNRTT